jgi:hypothetical protein
MGLRPTLTFGFPVAVRFGRAAQAPGHCPTCLNRHVAIPDIFVPLRLTQLLQESALRIRQRLEKRKNAVAELPVGVLPSCPTEPSVPKPVIPQSSAVDGARAILHALVKERGALGRGARALLQALHRRGNFLVRTAYDRNHMPDKGGKHDIYLEFCAAYVRTTARVTRYAVEQRAWSRIRDALQWDEVSTTVARQRGARLRRLTQNERYGRHLFIDLAMLAVAVDVAEKTLDTLEPGMYRGNANDTVEYIIDLQRTPIPNRRSVAARCPRRSAHSDGDSTPSLIMWMNDSGTSGGALCPVCMERGKDVTRVETSKQQDASRPLRNITWRVEYLPGNRAALFAPRSRARESSSSFKLTHFAKSTASHSLSFANVIPFSGEARKGKQRWVKRNKHPIGGHVMKDPRRTKQIGRSLRYAYIVAKLTVMNGVGVMDGSLDGPWASSSNDDDVDSIGNRAVRLRTVGTMSKRCCPQKVMMWSDKQSKGANTTRRVEDIAWYAAQSAAGSVEKESRVWQKGLTSPRASPAARDDASSWLPTNVLSVSAMKPSIWRDILSAGRIVSVPAGWEPSAQAWVLFDLDGVSGLQDEIVVAKAGTAMLRVVRRCTDLSGVCMVLQSGPMGIHIWAELREVRSNPRGWFSVAETRLWYASVGERLLAAAQRAGAQDGVVDMSSCAAGRFGRRAGWRILPDGVPFRSRIVTVATSRVRNRSPRLK